MLVKSPKKKPWYSFVLKLGVAGIVAEVAAIGTSYYFYRQLNSDQEVRHYFNENYPFVLEYFYKAGDFFDSEKGKQVRKQDQKAFAILREKQKPSE